MAAIKDAFTEARARHPHLVFGSPAPAGTGRLRRIISGSLDNTRPIWAIAVNANAGPALGSAWQPLRHGLPRPLDAGSIALVTLPTSPFWARRYTCTFLDSCRGIGEGTTETAELLVSELVTNAVRFANGPDARAAASRARGRERDIAVPAAFPPEPAH